ncbi:PAS domain S-box protein [Luteibacter sp. PPL201]|uniref:PAS domain S-box protein n=1 Tax=Luteibacter sahnii TaxID=3021977 RepID=A0ABT6BDJ9_9GAMM|nr:PAS domain S-box protein [Luteibacter sp. PPL193]MDY1550187.1 PAS domain S-box protein [Luteibacter sp. PPL193]
MPHDQADIEALRLARLDALQVLDSGSEPLFDALAEAAALVAGTPIALITLLDAERQWFKANIGLADIPQTARDIAFCDHTIRDDQILEVPDAIEDPRFASNPLVTGSPHIRFYAGMPIVLSDGVRLGSLCVIDHTRRELTPVQRKALEALGRATGEALEQRAMAVVRAETLEREAVRERQRSEAIVKMQTALAASERFLERTGHVAGVGGWQWDLRTDMLIWSAQTCRIHDRPIGHQPTLDEAIGYYAPDAQVTLREVIERCRSTGTGWDLELPLRTASGRDIWVHAQGDAIREGDELVGFIGALQDVTVRRQAVEALETSERRFRTLFQHSLGFICTHDAQGILMSVNPAAARALGYATAEVLGMPFTHFMRPERAPDFRTYLERVTTMGHDSGLMELVAKDGRVVVWQYHNVLDNDGAEPYVLGHAQDITEQRRQEKRLKESSFRDPLTGCGNRRMLERMTDKLPDDAIWGCIAIDLDRFKTINDTFGHQRGDEVLVQMAQFLHRRCGLGDVVVRLGGDEFLLVLEAGDAPYLAQVMAHLERDRDEAPIAFSMGAATRKNAESLERTVARADEQLYRSRADRESFP